MPWLVILLHRLQKILVVSYCPQQPTARIQEVKIELAFKLIFSPPEIARKTINANNKFVLLNISLINCNVIILQHIRTE